MKEIAEEQISAWKEKYGEVFCVKVDDKAAYLRKPTRHEMSYALTKVQTDPLGFNEALLNACWLAGDPEIKSDDDLFFAVGAQLQEIVGTKVAEIKKL